MYTEFPCLKIFPLHNIEKWDCLRILAHTFGIGLLLLMNTGPQQDCWVLSAAILFNKLPGSVKPPCPCHIRRRQENWKPEDLAYQGYTYIALNPISHQPAAVSHQHKLATNHQFFYKPTTMCKST